MSDQTDPLQSPLASALGITLSEDEAKTDTERKRAIAVNMTDADKANTDANFAREMLYKTIERNNSAIDQLAEIARESMTPRAYEVLALLLKQQSETTERFLKIHADKQKVQNNAINLVRNQSQVTPNTGNTNIVNIDKAVFYGTTAELLDMVRTAIPASIPDQSNVIDVEAEDI